MKRKPVKDVLEQAKEFVYLNARLLDRRRFEHHFAGSSREAVLDALRAYQNPDGGFGSALEPDLRGPHSQPVATEEALLLLDEIGGDPGMISRIVAFLSCLVREEGGVPRALIAVNQYPHAPWWNTEDDSRAALNPTGRLIGLLFKHRAFAETAAAQVRSDSSAQAHSDSSGQEGAARLPEWLERTLTFLWKKAETIQEADYHDWVQVLGFLEHAPDRARAEALLERAYARIRSTGAIELDPYAAGYVHTLLDWAPTPASLCRGLVSDELVERHLDALVRTQHEDGGWALSFPTRSAGAEAEWRGSLTVNRLLTLRAYGRI